MIRAGVPPAIARGGTFLVTTAPAATIAPSPMVTPLRMVARAPIQTLSPMMTGALMTRPTTSCWSVSQIMTCGPIMQSSPMTILVWHMMSAL